MEDPVDILHAHNPVMAVGARIVARSLPRRVRPRVVVTDHNVWHGYMPVSRWADGLTSRLDDARLTVSEAVRASLPAHIQRRSEVVLQGIEVAHVQAQRAQRAEVRAELGVDPGTIVIGTVANLRVQKAYPDLLEAAREVIERRPDVRFVAVGQGPLEAEIRAIHARLGLGDRLVLLGHRPDAVRVMGACDVFVLASHWEGLGVAVMEALALGLPVVATAVGGVPEVVEHGREGLLVPPARPDELRLRCWRWCGRQASADDGGRGGAAGRSSVHRRGGAPDRGRLPRARHGGAGPLSRPEPGRSRHVRSALSATARRDVGSGPVPAATKPRRSACTRWSCPRPPPVGPPRSPRSAGL